MAANESKDTTKDTGQAQTVVTADTADMAKTAKQIEAHNAASHDAQIAANKAVRKMTVEEAAKASEARTRRAAVTPEMAARLAANIGEVTEINGYSIEQAKRELRAKAILPSDSIYDPYGPVTFMPLPSPEKLEQLRKDVAPVLDDEEEVFFGV